MKGSHKEPLSTDFSKIPEQVEPLDPERRKNLDVCIRFLERWHRFDVDGFVDMMTPDGVIDKPYALKNRTQVGHEAIRQMYYIVMSFYGEHDCLWLNMYTTNDPATFVYKSKSWNKVMYGPSKGNVYSNDYVVFMEVKDDKVSRFTEYFNPQVMLASFDGKEENADIARKEAAAALQAAGSGS